jgi:glucokinase
MPTLRAPVLALDVGGTKLAAATVGPDGAVLVRAQVPTPGGGDGEALFGALVGVAATVLADRQPGAVGVSCGGPMSWPQGRVSPLNIVAWRDFPLRDRLAGHYRVPVRLHNDAVCVAVGEHWRGGGRGAADMLGLVVSTGVGGGLVLDGRLRDGPTGNAGHLGHVVVDPSGPACACGGRGCLEAVARGPAVLAWAGERGWRPGPGQAADGAALAAGARAGDPVAVAAFARAGDALGVALASVAALFDLELAVAAGGLAQAGDLLLQPARRALERHAGLAFAARMRLVPARLGPDAGLVGAAALVLAGDRYWSPSG